MRLQPPHPLGIVESHQVAEPGLGLVRLSIPFGSVRTRQRKGVSSPCASTWLAPFPIFQMAACHFQFSPSIGFEYSINGRHAGTEASSCLVLTCQLLHRFPFSPIFLGGRLGPFSVWDFSPSSHEICSHRAVCPPIRDGSICFVAYRYYPPPPPSSTESRRKRCSCWLRWRL